MTSDNLTLRDKLRADSVKRWHIVNTIRPQSVAEHSYNVAQISLAVLRKLCMEEYWGDRCCRLAVEHDQDEVIKGDMPSNAKSPKDWSDIFRGPMEPKHIVKMADVIDAYTWLYHNCADEHASKAVDWIKVNYDGMIDYLNDNMLQRYAIACDAVVHEILNGDFTI
jgi:HD containing hydrolase-like enzyme